MESVLVEQTTQTLPPLILHPFADAAGPGKLVESSRASLMLQGLLPTGELTPEQLEQRLMDGRYCEIRMLFYVGRDLTRWIHQCIDSLERDHEHPGRTYTFQSFVSYLIRHTPAPVQAKLRKWGVADYKSIFSRALALNTLFDEVPSARSLSPDFIRSYYKYTDAIFKVMMLGDPAEVDEREFEFSLYASGEYSRILEREWGDELAAE